MGERQITLICEDKNFAKNFLKNGEAAFGIKGFLGVQRTTGLYKVVFTSTELATKLRSSYKTRTKDWEIPPKIIQGRKGLKIEFLKGFVDSEGHVGLSVSKTNYTTKDGERRCCSSLQGYVNLSSTNEKGFQQVARLLGDLGIRIHLFKTARGDEWQISTLKNKSNLLAFKKLVDFRTTRDRERLKFLISNIHRSPNKWRWSGPLDCLPNRCVELIEQEKPRGVVFLDRLTMPQK